MLKDIQSCVDNSANFAATNLICCGIDFFGRVCCSSKPKKRFQKFVKSYFDQKYGDYCLFLYEVYRCGLVHQYFPKARAAIAGCNQDANCHLKLTDQGRRFTIHIKCFFDDFKKAIEGYQKDLETNPALQRRFDDETAKMEKEGEDEFNRIKQLTLKYQGIVETSCSGWGACNA